MLFRSREALVLAAPTINAYKRYLPFRMAPDRIVWSEDNKGAMLRVIGGVDDAATRIENRLGEPAANPYLYIASQIVCGLDGLERQSLPPAPSSAPYHEQAPSLPMSLHEAVQAFSSSDVFRAAWGDAFVDYYAALKNAEVEAFMRAVTDWEHREYFNAF